MEVYPGGKGDGLGTHLSFLVAADKANSKPFIGYINNYLGERILPHTLHFDGKNNKPGSQQFLTHSQVNTSLVSYDCIFFGISTIQSYK